MCRTDSALLGRWLCADGGWRAVFHAARVELFPLSPLVAYVSLWIIGDPIEALRRRIRDGRSTQARTPRYNTKLDAICHPLIWA
jgi:hypothetical protein